MYLKKLIFFDEKLKFGFFFLNDRKKEIKNKITF